jgi:hypothetical protein
MTSFQQQIQEALNVPVKNYISYISKVYELDEKQLLDIWHGQKNLLEKTENIHEEIIEEVVEEPSDPEKLLKCSKAELVGLCKSRGLKCSGKKSDLLTRLLGKDVQPEKKSKKKKPKKVTIETTKIFKKINVNIPTIQIRKNQFGNYEHPETGFVFSKEGKFVIGKQLSDGEISDLSTEDIDLCNKYKFSFNMPDNLNKKTGLDDVEVKDLDSSSDSEVIADESEEEKEEEEKEEEEEKDESEEESEADVDLEEFYDE